MLGILAASVAEEHFYALVLSQGVCKSSVIDSRLAFQQLYLAVRANVLTRDADEGSAIGASMMLYPSISAISTWFSKRRALALGLTSTVSTAVVIPTGAFANIVFSGRLNRRHCLPSTIPEPRVISGVWVGHASLCSACVCVRGKHLSQTDGGEKASILIYRSL